MAVAVIVGIEFLYLEKSLGIRWFQRGALRQLSDTILLLGLGGLASTFFLNEFEKFSGTGHTMSRQKRLFLIATEVGLVASYGVASVVWFSATAPWMVVFNAVLAVMWCRKRAIAPRP